MTTDFDCIVVGAGIIGSSAAYQLKKKQKLGNVLLLEQFPTQHTRGSSHGGTRITRLAHANETYLQIADNALGEYIQLERETGVKLFNNCGIIWLGPKQNEEIKSLCKTMKAGGADHEVISGEKLSGVYPGLRFDSDHCGVLDQTGGLLYADKCLRALQQEFLRMGGVIHDNEPVTDIRPGLTVTVTTSKQRYTARSLIICAGSWAGPMLNKLGLQLPLQPQLIKVCFWETTNPQLYRIDKFPALLTSDNDDHFHLYGLPIEEYPNQFKLCYHYGTETNPDKRDQTKPDPRYLTGPAKYLDKHFIGFDTKQPSIVETCLYTVTPDRHFIIDRHPTYRNIAIGAGFSGSGFKHAPTIGTILSNLAMQKQPGFDIGLFSVARFGNSNKSKI